MLNIRNQPFYVPLDASNLHWDQPNLSYEETVLFMVANFQYLITCMAFSIAKPFRKPIYTNIPFFCCVIFLFIFNILCVFLPSTNFIAKEFDLQKFIDEDGTKYYSYKFWIAFGILVNSILTYVAEKVIVVIFTRRSDRRLKVRKEAAFHE